MLHKPRIRTPAAELLTFPTGNLLLPRALPLTVAPAFSWVHATNREFPGPFHTLFPLTSFVNSTSKISAEPLHTHRRHPSPATIRHRHRLSNNRHSLLRPPGPRPVLMQLSPGVCLCQAALCPVYHLPASLSSFLQVPAPSVNT